MTTTDSGFVSGSQGKSPKRGEEKEDEEEGGIPGPAGTWGARGSAWLGPADSATPSAGRRHAPGGPRRTLRPALHRSFLASGASLRLGGKTRNFGVESQAWRCGARHGAQPRVRLYLCQTTRSQSATIYGESVKPARPWSLKAYVSPAAASETIRNHLFPISKTKTVAYIFNT